MSNCFYFDVCTTIINLDDRSKFPRSDVLNFGQFVLCVRPCIMIFIGIGFTHVFLNTLSLSDQESFMNNFAFAVDKMEKFNEGDFIINDFGIVSDGNPFLTVVGKAGGTIPQTEDTGYAYVFITDKGTFAVSWDWMYPNWHTHELTLDEKNCVRSMNMNGGVGTELRDVVKLTKINATRVDKVMTAEFMINNSDGSMCATKIFDSAP